MLKQWIRQRKLSRLTVDPNDRTMRCPIAEPETEGLMASAEACYEAWRSHFESQAWRVDAERSMRAVSAIFFHWAGVGVIVRPADVQFERLTGISWHYQYFMLREGEVLMRPHSCWCSACFEVAAAGPAAGLLTSLHEVRGCAKAGNALYEWHNSSCRAKTGAEASSPDQRARARGHGLAQAGIEPGQWVLVEAFCDEEDEMWLGRALPFGDFGPRSPCCKKFTDATPKNLYGTRFNTGDYMVAVQWYERLTESGDGERREFIRGTRMIDVFNSTELRLVGFRMEVIGALARKNDGDEPDPEEARIKWKLPRDSEAQALTWCR